LPAGFHGPALGRNAGWGCAVGLGAVPFIALARMLQAPEGQVSSTRVTVLALVQMLDNGSDVLYVTTGVFATYRLFQLCALFVALPTLWFLAVLARVKLSLNRVWSLALYGDPYSDDSMRSITPLAALERPGPPVQERERMHVFWWWACAPAVLIARPALLSLDAAARRLEHSPAAVGLLGLVRFVIRAAIFVLAAFTLPLAFGASALAAVGYVLALGPIMLRLEMLSAATTANRYFMRCDPLTPEPLDAEEMAFLYQTRGLSHALLQSAPQALVTISNVAALKHFLLPTGYEQFSKLSKVTLAFSLISLLLNLAHWVTSYMQFRGAAAKGGKGRASLSSNMAHWDRLRLLNGPGAFAFTDAGAGGMPVAAAPAAASAAAILPVLSAAAPPPPPPPPQPRSRAARARAAAPVDKYELLLADVRRGARVELKPDAPEKFRADTPGTILLPGARGVIDEDAPCANPYVHWEGGGGRIFFHISDLYLVVPRRTRGAAFAFARGRRRSDSLAECAAENVDGDMGDEEATEEAAPPPDADAAADAGNGTAAGSRV